MNSSDHDLTAAPVDHSLWADLSPDGSQGLSEPVIDLQVLDELRALEAAGKPDFLRRLLTMFTGHAPGLLAALREALDRQDAKSLAGAAHALKSSSGNMGAARLMTLCMKLERLARSGSLTGARELIAAVDAEYASATNALADHVGAR